MGSYIRNSLSVGEIIIIEAKHHWMRYFPIVFGFLIVLTGLLFAIYFGSLRGSEGYVLEILMMYFFFGLLTLVFCFKLVKLLIIDSFIELAVTNRSLYYKKGILKRELVTMNIKQIETIEVKKTLLGMILNYGNIRVISNGEAIAVYPGISDPNKFRNELMSIA